MRFWTAGVEFAVIIGLITAGGYWLDRWLNTLPLWTLIGLALGFGGALYRLVRQAQMANKTESSDEEEDTK